MFRLIDYVVPKIERIDSDKGRRYVCPNPKSKTGFSEYPSVTTVLSADDSKKESLDTWKKNVGEEQAARVSARASSRGERIHKLVENFLLNKESQCNLLDKEIWLPMKKILLENITEVYAIEKQLYSNYLRVAGTVDLIAKYKGKVTIIDIKTSAKFKFSQEIPHYFEQCASYAVMWEELTKMPVPNLQIIMGCDESNETLLYSSKRDLHIKDFMKKRKHYAETVESNAA